MNPRINCIFLLKGHCGPPTEAMMVKLVDVPSMEYYAKDGKGEVRLNTVQDYMRPRFYYFMYRRFAQRVHAYSKDIIRILKRQLK